MNYPTKFIAYVELCIKYNRFIGIGNPWAEIVIICEDIRSDIQNINTDWYNANAEYWKKHIKKESSRQELGLEIYADKSSTLLNKSHTWNKFQRLHDLIFKDDMSHLCKQQDNGHVDMPYVKENKSLKPPNDKRFDFLERFFLVELPQDLLNHEVLQADFIQKKEITLTQNDLFAYSKSEDLFNTILDIRFSLWDGNIPIIDGYIDTSMFVRRDGYTLTSGITISATTKLFMNFEGLAIYNNEVVDVLAIPEKYFIKEQEELALLNIIPPNHVMNIESDTLKFRLILELKLIGERKLRSIYAIHNIDIIDNTDITYGDLQRVKYINTMRFHAHEKSIDNYSVLKYCNNIEEIVLHHATSKQLKELSVLRKVKKFICSGGSTIDNLDFIKKWSTLEELTILGCEIKDISALEFTDTLKKVKFSLHKGCELFPISFLKDLEHMKLHANISRKLECLEIFDNYKKIDIRPIKYTV